MEQPASTPLPQQSQDVLRSTSKNNVVLILIGIVLLVLVGGGMFVLGQKSQPVTQVMITPTLMPTVAVTAILTPTPVIDATASWKLYTDKDFQYSIKTPPEYILDDRAYPNIHFTKSNTTGKTPEPALGDFYLTKWLPEKK